MELNEIFLKYHSGSARTLYSEGIEPRKWWFSFGCVSGMAWWDARRHRFCENHVI